MTTNGANRMGWARIAVAVGAAAAAGYAVAGAETTVEAVGLEGYEGELIEFGYPDPRQAGGFEVLDLALIENGKATMRAELDAPLGAEFVVVVDDGPRARGIVEPGGRHELVADGSVLGFSGGDYQALIGSVQETPDDQEVDRLRGIYDKHEDPHARVLALRHGWKDRTGAWRDTEDPEQIAVLAELEAILGENLSIELINALIDSRDEAAAKAIKDFTALNLAGEEVRLRDVLRENKYTLVEFWASWCGPCIGEIPHLQEAYERFRSNGFEILAVNLDDDPENWRVASEDDYDINWLNVSDNQAFGSPVAKLYRVKAIPANFLVSTEGKTVARHLRGTNVSETLAGLLGE
ncbi:MAG: TlpA disulfide reductase family protein [Gammaproteobacteria bacterium]|nr:TlpA disulfide reductase family protein [Gammaproteobacteria bacterium]MDE0440906.1 TlpA disulfide reductase family protein [Gammaproteobacteria bacterium]